MHDPSDRHDYDDHDDAPNPFLRSSGGGGLPTGPQRFVGAVVSGVFAVIGLTVIGFLWGAPFGAFGSPPVFFRIFGSLIAIVFVVVGGTGCYAAARGVDANRLRGPGRVAQRLREFAAARRDPRRRPSPDAGGYSCPRCAAPLAERADVSPHGDVKCTFCGAWFNVHGRRADSSG